MKNSYHFIGIGGIGMSALAQILLQRGDKVTGSDLASSYITDALKKNGAEIFVGHHAKNVEGANFVVFSTDVKQENEELKEAKAKKMPLLHRSQLLYELMKGYSSLLVSGTHGKTTTSSLLAHILKKGGIDPCFAIGGIVKSLGSNGGYGKGSYFVAEADESDGSFLAYDAFGAIITNIDGDHLDYWKTMKDLERGFKSFADGVSSKEHLFWCRDDEILSSFMKKGVGYGFSEKAELCIKSFSQEGLRLNFDFSFDGKEYKQVEVPLIGRHNVLNSASVFGMALRAGMDEEDVRRAFASFQGVGRRVEKKGEMASICLYDDYAHHPTEISCTLGAIKSAFSERRLVVAFQPHRFTRTRDCFDQFGPALKEADEIIVTDIFAAREQPIEGITIELLLKRIQEQSGKSIHYVPRDKLADFLLHFLQPHDILLTMGAGDVTKVCPELLKKFSK